MHTIVLLFCLSEDSEFVWQSVLRVFGGDFIVLRSNKVLFRLDIIIEKTKQ